MVDSERNSKSDCRLYKRAGGGWGGSSALQRSLWRSWALFIGLLFFSRSLRAERWGNIYRLSIPKHNRIFMKAISTCWNRNDFDLTVIYISIWVERPQWELPYILCESQEWRWGSLSTLYTLWFQKLPFKSNSVCYDFELSSISRERFSSSGTDNPEMFHFNIFSIFTVIHLNFLPSNVSPQDDQTLFNSDGLPWKVTWTCKCLVVLGHRDH